MKKVVAFILALVTLVTVLAVPVAATDGVGTYGTDWIRYGDIDADQSINAKDALSVLKYAVAKMVFTDVQMKTADVNFDGSINARDALDILKYAVAIITEFVAGNVYQINDGGSVSPDPTPTPTPTPDTNEGADYIATYNKSNSLNGAYTKDTSADTSYQLDISDLKSNTYYIVSSSAMNNRSGVANEADIKRLLFSLQGLVNRDFGIDSDHTSLIYVDNGDVDKAWLSEMQKEGSIFQNMSRVRIQNWTQLLNHFLPTIKKAGIMLWDGNVPATANVAATICGLDGYLPVLANSPLHETLVDKGVDVKMTLVNRFKNGNTSSKIVGTTITSTGSAKNDAYLWALQKYFHRCSTKYIAYTPDGATVIKNYDAYTDNPIALLGDGGISGACLSNHDYLIARRCFFFDLSPYGGEAACDDPAQKNGQANKGIDNSTMLTIFQRRYERANGAFGAMMGFVPWWIKYTKHNSQGSIDGAVMEWMFCEYITCYNLAKEADAAHPSSMTNGSFMYKYIPQTTKYENNEKAENISYNSNTFYYTIYVGDYDSSAWLKEHIYTMWLKGGGDDKLGTLPLMWSINPNLSERVPVIFEYLYANKSSRDYFVGGDGGAGYIIPEALFTGRTLTMSGHTRPSNYGNGSTAFANLSKTFYDRFDMKMTGFIINSGHRTLTREVAACISSYSPLLNFTTCYNNPLVRYGNTYFVYCQNELTEKTTVAGTTNYNLANHYITNYMKNGNFGAFRTVCWSPTQISQFVEGFASYKAGQGKTVKYCDPYTYLNMLKASGRAAVLG